MIASALPSASQRKVSATISGTGICATVRSALPSNAAAARQKIAAKALAGQDYAAHPRGHHVWLRLPTTWSRLEFAAHVQRQGLAVVTSDSFTVDDAPEHAIRIALGAARSRADLAGALDVLSVALKSPVSVSRIV